MQLGLDWQEVGVIIPPCPVRSSFEAVARLEVHVKVQFVTALYGHHDESIQNLHIHIANEIPNRFPSWTLTLVTRASPYLQ